MVKLLVQDLMCENCAASIRKALGQVDGVGELKIDVAAKSVEVLGTAAAEVVVDAVRKAGYQPQVAT